MVLKHSGCYVSANVGLWPMLRTAITRRVTDKRVITKLARITKADLQTLCKQIDEKTIETSIEAAYKLEELVEAHRYIDTGNKRVMCPLFWATLQNCKRKTSNLKPASPELQKIGSLLYYLGINRAGNMQ